VYSSGQSDEAGRRQFRDAIIDRYFPSHRDKLLAIAEDEQEIGIYERAMEERIDGGSRGLPQVKETVRDTAFGRTVRKAYDYRCAACGIRVVLDDIYIVDAAHLIPFAESHDDDPRNGIALCKNHHWSMDRALIAPGDDLLWHVSSMLDDRIEGQRDLIVLRNRTVLVPTNQRYYPRQDALRWRQERLRT
jgi:putative restriction endonuclease